MTPEEINDLIAAAVSAAIAPLTAEIEALTTRVNGLDSAVTDLQNAGPIEVDFSRVDALETNYQGVNDAVVELRNSLATVSEDAAAIERVRVAVAQLEADLAQGADNGVIITEADYYIVGWARIVLGKYFSNDAPPV